MKPILTVLKSEAQYIDYNGDITAICSGNATTIFDKKLVELVITKRHKKKR